MVMHQFSVCENRGEQWQDKKQGKKKKKGGKQRIPSSKMERRKYP